MKQNVIAMLLAGGVGSRLGILAKHRAKPAMPFGGIYRIIDFTLSNIANSGIKIVGVLTQYKPLSLMEHIDNGSPWDLAGRTRAVKILPPKTGEESYDWYKGTSDAIYQNIGFVNDYMPDLVLIVSGDHIYHMDYNALISYHLRKKSRATACLIRVPPEQASSLGIAELNSRGIIIDWEEKPSKPKSNLASMGIYVFERNLLSRVLAESVRKGGVDFAKDVFPLLFKNETVYGFEFSGYWRDVGTINAYWQTNMDLLIPDSGLDIYKWRIKTNVADRGEIGDRPSSYFARSAKVRNSLISRGCVVEGEVVNSILSPGVVVRRRSRIKDSIIFHDATIGSESVICNVISDKDVVVGDGSQVGVCSIDAAKPPRQFTIIGKGAVIPKSSRIASGTVVKPTA